MALPVLDGNQSATTLSSVVTGGEHIVAHSVVCLGSTAISNITSAVSGSVVSVSNFPASQSTTFGAVTGSVSVLNFPSTQTVAGTVTANAKGIWSGDNNLYDLPVLPAGEFGNGTRIPVSIVDSQGNTFGIGNDGADRFQVDANIGNSVTIGSLPAISGTVTANAGTELGTTGNGYGFIALGIDDVGTASALSLDNNGNLRAVVGAVTAAAPNGSLTTRFGTPTTANVSFATSAVTNANRKYLLIQNVTTGSNVITVGIGFTPTITQGIQLTAGAGITFESSYIPTGAVYVLSSVTASNFTILEA